MMPKSITVGELLNNEHYVQVTGDEKSLERPIYVAEICLLYTSQRAEIANKNNAGAFIRLHCNSDDSSSIHGTLTMAPSESNPYCSQIATASQRLSKTVVNSICNQTGSKNRGVIITDVMSGINWCQVPVTIVEMGFMSNPDERCV